MPSRFKLKSPIRIEFTTDSTSGRRGFSMNYKRDGCGGYVNKSKIIDYNPKLDLLGEGYFLFTPDLCIWEIEAPVDMVVIVK